VECIHRVGGGCAIGLLGGTPSPGACRSCLSGTNGYHHGTNGYHPGAVALTINGGAARARAVVDHARGVALEGPRPTSGRAAFILAATRALGELYGSVPFIAYPEGCRKCARCSQAV